MSMRKLEGWQVVTKGHRPLKDVAESFFVNLTHLISAVPETYHLTTEQAAALQPPTEPPRVAGDQAGWLLQLCDGQAFFIVMSDAELSTLLQGE